MYNTWFDILEDWFLSLKFIEDKWPENVYFSLCRFKTKCMDILWYGPKNFIHNIFIFRTFLWGDRWFDSYYLLNMIRIKLGHDSKMYKKYGIAVGSEEVSEQMEYCSKLAGKLCDDNYDSEHLKLHDEKWGELSFKRTGDKSGSSCLKRSKVLSDEECEQERKEFMEHITMSDIERNKDQKLLFEVIEKNIKSWWD